MAHPAPARLASHPATRRKGLPLAAAESVNLHHATRHLSRAATTGKAPSRTATCAHRHRAKVTKHAYAFRCEPEAAVSASTGCRAVPIEVARAASGEPRSSLAIGGGSAYLRPMQPRSSEATPPATMIEAVRRGLRRRCPHCGEGALFVKYIKVRAHCPVCGEDNARHSVDDAASYTTVLLVGHVLVAPLLAVESFWDMSLALVLALLVPLVAGCTLMALPFIKGGIIGAMSSMAQARRAADEGSGSRDA